jgi:hypothetical protein
MPEARGPRSGACDVGPEPPSMSRGLRLRLGSCGLVGFSSTFCLIVPIGADAITQTLRP